MGMRQRMNWRAPEGIRAYADEQADEQGISVNEWLTRLVIAHRDQCPPVHQGQLFPASAGEEYPVAS